MKVRVLAFAGVREILGRGELQVELPEGSRMSDLQRQLDERHPALAEYWDRLAVAIDGKLGGGDPILTDGTEVALLPPVSGGMDEHPVGETRVHLVEGVLDAAAVAATVTGARSGALVTFQGNVRDNDHGLRVTHLTYDAYRPMALEALERIVGDLEAADPDLTVAISHRLGAVPVGETSVIIATCAPHRDAAYRASRDALERLKREVPIWKREHYADGDPAWREEEPLQRRNFPTESRSIS